MSICQNGILTFKAAAFSDGSQTMGLWAHSAAHDQNPELCRDLSEVQDFS